jgi:hypothetical protein
MKLRRQKLEAVRAFAAPTFGPDELLQSRGHTSRRAHQPVHLQHCAPQEVHLGVSCHEHAAPLWHTRAPLHGGGEWVKKPARARRKQKLCSFPVAVGFSQLYRTAWLALSLARGAL